MLGPSIEGHIMKRISPTVIGKKIPDFSSFFALSQQMVQILTVALIVQECIIIGEASNLSLMISEHLIMQ